jgi:hypothetical protein
MLIQAEIDLLIQLFSGAEDLPRYLTASFLERARSEMLIHLIHQRPNHLGALKKSKS